MLKRLATACLRAIEGRASIENPNTPLSDRDSDWLGDIGGPAASGVKVNRESALRYSPIWRGVNLISRDVAKLPCVVYVRDGEGKQQAVDHPAFRILRRKPNREMTAFVFKQTLISHAILDGNGMAFIDRFGDGSPRELIPLAPGKCWPMREDGKLLYVVEVGGEWRKLLPENIFHLKGLSLDGLCGYSLIEKAKESLGLGIAAQQYGSRYFRNNARPSAVIQHPTKLGDVALRHLRESWNEIHSGVENSHKIAILEEGMTLAPFQINARDSQLLETRQFEIREVSNWIGVPPHKLGDSARAAYNSLEQENQSYLDDALDPWLVAFEEEAYEKLLSEDEKAKGTHTVEFTRQALLRADMSTRGEFYAKATGNLPWMTGNEVRGRENLNPIEGFDTIILPTNNFGDQGATGRTDATDAARAVLLDAVRRMARRCMVHARKAAKRPEDLDAWLDVAMRSEHGATVREAIAAAVAVVRAAGRPLTVDDAANALFVRAGESIRGTRASLASDDLSDQLAVSIADSVVAQLLGE